MIGSASLLFVTSLLPLGVFTIVFSLEYVYDLKRFSVFFLPFVMRAALAKFTVLQ